MKTEELTKPLTELEMARLLDAAINCGFTEGAINLLRRLMFEVEAKRTKL